MNRFFKHTRKAMAAVAVVALALPALAQPVAGPSRGAAFVRDSLDTYVQREMRRWQIPAVAVAIVKDGRVVAQRAYGTTSLVKGAPVDTNTLFMIGSNTKAFIGTTLAWLEHDGQWKLGDPVQKYVPYFTLSDPYRAQNTSLSDVVSHQMGFETFQGDFMYWGSDLSPRQCMEKMGRLKPLYGFRNKWGYTNMGYVVAAEAIKNVSGETWDAFIRQRMLTPLNMKSTVVTIAELGSRPNKTAGHTWWEGKLQGIPYGRFDNIGPAASISSSAADMSHWLLAQLDSGKYAGKRVIPFPVIQRTRTPFSIQGRARTRSYTSHYQLYGLGWGLEDANGREIVSHTGGVDGYVTSVTLIPEERLGIVVLTNTDHNSLYDALKRELIDAYLGLPYRGYSQLYYNRAWAPNHKQEDELLARQRDTIKTKPAVTLGLDAYVGTYENDPYGQVTVMKSGRNLVMKFQHHSRLTCTLEPLGGSRFLATYSDPLYGRKVFTFTTANGKVETFNLLVADFLEFTPYLFKKTS